MLEHGGAGQFFGWRTHDERSDFGGELSDPMPVTIGANGSLRVAVSR